LTRIMENFDKIQLFRSRLFFLGQALISNQKYNPKNAVIARSLSDTQSSWVQAAAISWICRDFLLLVGITWAVGDCRGRASLAM